MAQTLDQVFEALADLLDAHTEADEEDLGPGENNFQCEDCVACNDCRFCTGCSTCERCNYCEDCEGCVDCTQCRASLMLENCSHSDHSRACARSQYLTLCFDCEDCVQCFACVGLSGAEFHVLNEKYSRREYFELVGRLRAELDRLAEAGMRAAFEDDPEAWFEAVDAAAEAAPRPSIQAARAPERADRASVVRGKKPERPSAPLRPDTERRAPSRLRAGRRPGRS